MSEVGIDALVIKARATARELNHLLAQLEKNDVEVTVVSTSPHRGDIGVIPRLNRVTLVCVFPIEDE
jgi:hypothetical protein